MAEAPPPPDDVPAAPLGLCREIVGTPTTMAPEVAQGAWHDPFAADAWSLGVCLLALLAPREHDEYDYQRTPFYPWVEACATRATAWSPAWALRASARSAPHRPKPHFLQKRHRYQP